MHQTGDDRELWFIYDENGQPYILISIEGSDVQVYWYLINAVGDVIGLLNSTQQIVATYRYDPYERIIDEWINPTDDIGTINPLRYRGYYYDSETGFYYLQSRYYDPEIGRFISNDSFATTDRHDLLSCNMFAYCLNDPVNRIDEGGELSVWATTGLIVGTVFCGAAVTVLTCGVGTATLAGTIAVGAAKGTLIGVVTGTALGAGVGYVSTGTLEGMVTGTTIGFSAGAVAGAAVGGSIAGVNYGTFSSPSKLVEHFTKHGGEFGGLYSNAKEYAKGAKYVMKNGTYI